MTERSYRFRLLLSADQVLSYYQGHVKSVVVQADNGLRNLRGTLFCKVVHNPNN